MRKANTVRHATCGPVAFSCMFCLAEDLFHSTPRRETARSSARYWARRSHWRESNGRSALLKRLTSWDVYLRGSQRIASQQRRHSHIPLFQRSSQQSTASPLGLAGRVNEWKLKWRCQRSYKVFAKGWDSLVTGVVVDSKAQIHSERLRRIRYSRNLKTKEIGRSYGECVNCTCTWNNIYSSRKWSGFWRRWFIMGDYFINHTKWFHRPQTFLSNQSHTQTNHTTIEWARKCIWNELHTTLGR